MHKLVHIKQFAKFNLKRLQLFKLCLNFSQLMLPVKQLLTQLCRQEHVYTHNFTCYIIFQYVELQLHSLKSHINLGPCTYNYTCYIIFQYVELQLHSLKSYINQCDAGHLWGEPSRCCSDMMQHCPGAQLAQGTRGMCTPSNFELVIKIQVQLQLQLWHYSQTDQSKSARSLISLQLVLKIAKLKNRGVCHLKFYAPRPTPQTPFQLRHCCQCVMCIYWNFSF